MKTTSEISLPAPSPGTRRALTVHRYGEPGARPKAYFQAALHADEAPGLLVLHHLQRLLDDAAGDVQVKGEIIIVPVANPIGLDQHINGHLVGRFDFGTGLNFNRGFPDLTEAVLGRVEGRLSDDLHANTVLIRQALVSAARELPGIRDTDALKAALLGLSIDADLVFDLHCDGEALVHLYASRRHREQALALGGELGAAVVLLEDDPGGNPFDEANAGVWWRLGARLEGNAPIAPACFGVTIELRGQADVYDHYAQEDAARLFRFLQRRGVIAGTPEPRPEASPLEAPLEGVDVMSAPAAGIVAYRKTLGDWVDEGEVIAELVDLTAGDSNDARIPIHSRTAGIFFARMAEKLVRPGQSICKVAGTKKLEHREAGKLLES